MALLFASAAATVPRFIEFMGETNSIVTEYIETSNNPDEQIRQEAWTKAINCIKRHGAWHSGLLAIKIFGDGAIFFTAGKLLLRWLDKLFLFLRPLYSQSKDDLIAQLSTIKDRVMKFYQSLTEMGKSIEPTSGTVSALGANEVAKEIASGRLNPTNLLQHLWKLLNNSYSCVVQWIWFLKGTFTFEMTKYAIQICGCIYYYLELLDKTWNFGWNQMIN